MKVTPDESYKVHATEESVFNQFADVNIPKNPGMAPNGMNGAHQDSWCSESVPYHGPNGGRLRMIRKYNPYGFTPIMGCNHAGQMIGMCHKFAQQAKPSQFNLIVFDEDCEIISATPTGSSDSFTFAGGYFYLDDSFNAVVVGDGCVKCLPTGQTVEAGDTIKPLEPLWTSENIIELVNQKLGLDKNAPNVLYANLPYWETTNEAFLRTWCLMAGDFDKKNDVINTEASIALVQIARDGSSTEVLAVQKCPKQWNNNTFAVTQSGAIFVTNGGRTTSSEDIAESYIWKVGASMDTSAGGSGWSLNVEWKTAYDNCQLLKIGQTNIGSGTTPTVFDDGKQVAITDNNNPRLQVCVYDTSNGTIKSKTPVFPPMRGADEASLIGAGQYLVVENNFGHATGSVVEPQKVANEPGMARLYSASKSTSKSTDGTPQCPIQWESNESFLAMTMLCRKSGLIFATTGDWSSDNSAVDGAMYYMTCKDSYDGRIIWRLPMGVGRTFAHDYGGIYFHSSGDKLYVGTENYIVCVQNVDIPSKC